MKELRVLSNLLRFIINEIESIDKFPNEQCEMCVLETSRNLINSIRSVEDMYYWSISKGFHESNLSPVPGKSVASEQPVHGES